MAILEVQWGTDHNAGDLHRLRNLLDGVLPKDAVNLSQLTALIQNDSWQQPIKDQIDFTTAEPVGPSIGDRYINTVTGVSNGTAQPVTVDRIYEWNGTDWTETIPLDGFATYDQAADDIYTYDGAVWVSASGGGEDLAATLILGNNSGANHIIMDNQQEIQFRTSSNNIADNSGTFNLTYEAFRGHEMITGDFSTLLSSTLGFFINQISTGNVFEFTPSSKSFKFGDGGAAIKFTVDFSALATSNKTASFQNASGTIAYLADLHSAVTMSGTPNYITLVGQDIVRGLIDLATDITGTLAVTDGGTGVTTYTALTANLDLFTSLLKGLVPASGGGTVNFLRADGTWADPTGGLISSALPSVQALRTTTLTYTLNTFTDVTFNSTDVENDSAVIEHNNVLTDRIDVKEDGLYLISYKCHFDADNGAVSADPNLQTRVRVNDTTVLPGSFASNFDHYSGSGGLMEEFDNVAVFVAELTAGDYVTLQQRYLNSVSTADNNGVDPVFTITKLQGSKGDTGATGAGANIILQKDDVTVGTVTATLNFEGAGVTSVVDDGGNKTTVTIGGGGGFLTSTLTPPQITSAQNDYSPASLAPNQFLRLDSDANYDVTGIDSTGFSDRDTLVIVNIGLNDIKLKENDGLSLAANRFLINADINLQSEEAATLIYDATSSRWRCIGEHV